MKTRHKKRKKKLEWSKHTLELCASCYHSWVDHGNIHIGYRNPGNTVAGVFERRRQIGVGQVLHSCSIRKCPCVDFEPSGLIGRPAIPPPSLSKRWCPIHGEVTMWYAMGETEWHSPQNLYAQLLGLYPSPCYELIEEIEL